MANSAIFGAEPTEAAARMVAILQDHAVTHVVTVPDNTSAPILSALEVMASADTEGRDADDGKPEGELPVPRLLMATREGEAMGIASGLWLGGSDPVVLIQNTGLLEAGDGLRGTAARMGVPLVLLITARGYAKARKAGVPVEDGITGRDILVREDLDSVAHMTESTLRAWGIPFLLLRDSGDLSPVKEAFARARAEKRPVAVLMDTSFD
jgi:sulfopyruvate decarboxylase TPP-binding subunit